jgi:hypothetical protein
MKRHLLNLALPLLLCSQAWAEEKPNVLFIAIDDLNDWVGCLGGHPQTLTPNIDRLAAQGMLFTNAHCQAPICGPSRASIMTGLYPSNSGNYLQLSDRDIKKSNDRTGNAIFLPDHFEAHGYKTMAVGKSTMMVMVQKHLMSMGVYLKSLDRDRHNGSSMIRPGRGRMQAEPKPTGGLFPSTTARCLTTNLQPGRWRSYSKSTKNHSFSR